MVQIPVLLSVLAFIKHLENIQNKTKDKKLVLYCFPSTIFFFHPSRHLWAYSQANQYGHGVCEQ